MHYRNDRPQVQIVDDRLQITELLLEAVGCAGGLVGLPKSLEVEGYDTPASGDEIRNEIVVNPQVVGKPVHEHKGGTSAFVLACIDSAMVSPNMMLGEAWFAVYLAVGF